MSDTDKDSLIFEDFPEDIRRAIQSEADRFVEELERSLERFMLNNAHLGTKH